MTDRDLLWHRTLLVLAAAYFCGIGAVFVPVGVLRVLFILLQLILLAYLFLSFFASFTKEWKTERAALLKSDGLLRRRLLLWETAAGVSSLGVFAGTVGAVLLENSFLFLVIGSLSAAAAITAWRFAIRAVCETRHFSN